MKIEQSSEIIRISVRNLVEFILRSGDLDNRGTKSSPKEAMQEGSRIHRKIQKQMGPAYQAEVALKMEFPQEDFTILLEGRADGILVEEEQVTIDEIKGVYRNLVLLDEMVPVHRAQALCYAYLYAKHNSFQTLSIQLTYVNLDTEEVRRFHENLVFSELEQWFYDLLEKYKKWAQFQFQWKKTMRESAQSLSFPYPYRKGQKELAADVYRSFLRKKILFVQAPTGVGKTISTVFPAVHAAGEGLADKIFYLTAKSITGNVARETFELLMKEGYRGKVIQITAKEKMCVCEEMECNPDHCSCARGHFDRVNDAVFDFLQNEDLYSREQILTQAAKFQVCPFEFSLDVASWSDAIICDYNYVFDPNVYLKRFFAEGQKGEYLFLVDEAHNLVERGRNMYSEQLYKEDFLEIRKLVKNIDSKLADHLNRCNRLFLEYKRECDTYCLIEDDLAAVIFALLRLAERFDRVLETHPEFPERKTVIDFYMNLRNFLNIYERVDERYQIYAELEADGRFKIRLFCVDPSFVLQECLNKGRATVFFSATLLPVSYYKKMLSTRPDNYAIYADTSFSEHQSRICIGSDVSSRYTRRTEQEFRKIAEYIRMTASMKKGNYMVFFPSYRLMEQVHEQFLLICQDEYTVLMQTHSMGESEREQFLQEFSVERDNSMLAFCVLGGIYGEGIDLTGEKLVGAVIVGTGIPQIGSEREIIKEFFDETAGEGFCFAYQYPGMNKVLQAAGRVIRTAQDFGIITLLDERFLQSGYQQLFPREWKKLSVCSVHNYEETLSDFWKEL